MCEATYAGEWSPEHVRLHLRIDDPTREVVNMKVMAFTAAASGALFAVALSSMFGSDAGAPLRVVVVASFFLMLGITAALGRFDTPIVFVGPFLFIGISVGVFANTIYDWLVHRVDHSLFPVEIAVIAVLAMPGAIAGAALTWLLRRRQPE